MKHWASLSRKKSQVPTLKYTLAHTNILTHIHTHTHTLMHTYTGILSHTLIHTHTYTLTHTNSCTHTEHVLAASCVTSFVSILSIVKQYEGVGFCQEELGKSRLLAHESACL